MKTILFTGCCLLLSLQLISQEEEKATFFPVIGFSIAAPVPEGLDSFVHFIENELQPRHINTLLLRVDFNFQYAGHPELRDENALSVADVKKIVKCCRKLGMRLIPQINLLGHQSWAEKANNLLLKYPQFDETPQVKMPDKYAWPNPDNLYCKSYCPLHPDIHPILFSMIDEVMDAFEATAFHAGMDEVFYIGEDQCPRCAGADKAVLFAGEVQVIQQHLAQHGQELWIWGDRLLDGKTTGLGMWEASMNNTHRAIDMISKEVVICDWHYEHAEPTATYFAMKGFRVITCPWNRADVAIQQYHDTKQNRNHANDLLASRYLGMMQTVWSDANYFINAFYGKEKPGDEENGSVNCFRELFKFF